MRSNSLSSLFLVGVLGLGLGSGLVLTLRETGLTERSMPDPIHSSNTSMPQKPTQISCRELMPPEIVTATKAIGELIADTPLSERIDPDDPASIATLFDSAKTDFAIRQSLIERYRSASEGEAKQMLGHFLANLQTPDVLDFSLELTKAENADERQQGFQLLAELGLKLPQVRQAARQALATDVDPGVLRQALAVLQPATVDPVEHVDTLTQLQTLTSHRDSDVRAQAISSLAAWDKSGEFAATVTSALADQSENVRSAAISAIAENRIRSDSLKTSLLAMVGNGEEAPDIRLNAGLALEQFVLTRDESVKVKRWTIDVDRMINGESGFNIE